MRKLVMAIIATSLLLSGCVINRVSVYKASGDKLGFPLGGIIPVSGEDIKGYLVHWFFYTDEKDRKIPPPPVVTIYESDKDEDRILIKTAP